MIVYKDTAYDSKAAVVRAMFVAGDMDNSPEQKKRVALLLGMTVQTVHATLVKMDGKVVPPVAPTLTAIVNPLPKVNERSDAHKAIEQKYNECYEIAKAKGYDLPKIGIEWNLRGAVAGQFCNRYGRLFFKVNMALAKANLDDYLKQTVPHEFSHYIVRQRYGRMAKAHGWEWKQTMLSVFGLYPHRCHSYDVSAVKQNRRHYQYKCPCGKTYNLGAKRHRLLQWNQRKYWCGACKGFLTFVNYV